MEAWETFLNSLETDFGAQTVKTWLRSLKVLRFDACNLYLEAKDSFQVLWFEEHIRPLANQQLFNNNHKKIRVHIKALKSNKDKEAAPAKVSAQEFSYSADSLDPQQDFDSCVPFEGNQLGLKLLSSLSASPDGISLASYNPIFIYGPSGSGKTHLLTACSKKLRAEGLNVIYVRAETFTEHVVRAMRSGDMQNFRQTYRQADMLIIDDVSLFSKKTATQEELFHTFNTLHLAEKQIIFSAPCAPGELQHIEPRLISRFEWGILVPLDPPSAVVLEQILKNKLQRLELNLENEAQQFLLEKFSKNSNSLAKAINALSLRAHMQNAPENLHKTPLSLSKVQSLLKDLLEKEEEIQLTPDKIIACVADYYGLKSQDLLGKAQSREYTQPRQVAMFLCRDHLNMPYTRIGDVFKRDHSTVISSYRLIKKSLEDNKTAMSTIIPQLVQQMENIS